MHTPLGNESSPLVLQSPPPLRVAWITDFPLEWLPDLPEALKHLPRGHPLTWQRVLLDEFENRADLQLHIIVLRKGIKSSLQFKRKNVTFHVLAVPGGVRATTFFWWDTFCVKRELAKLQPDLVHAWGTEKGAGVVAGRLNYPSVLTIQGLLTWLSEKVPLNAYHKFAAHLERKSFRGPRVVTTEPRFALDYLQRKFPGIRVLQAEHAPNRVFLELHRAIPFGKARLLFCGLITPLKGIDLLFAALERLPESLNWECVCIGKLDPAFANEWSRMQRSPVWKRIQWRQNLTPKEVASELSRATLFVFPTRADTSPNAVKEAVVAGVPVVASAIGGITDYVIPGKNGLLFETGHVDQLATSLQEALRHPLFSKGMVDSETLSLTRHYLSPEKMALRFVEAYNIAVGRRTLPKDPFLPFP